MAKTLRRRLGAGGYQRTIALLACALSLAACAEGWEASEAESRTWLPGAYPHLKRVIVLLRTCQPRRPNGYNTIWVDRSNDDVEPHCSFGDDSDVAKIREELRQARVLGVAYLPSGSPAKAVNWVEFILFREGLVTAGSSTSVTYKAEAQPCVAKSEGDGSFRVIERPIAPAPCRWFWVRSEG
jgi:hypothetical protein